MDRRRFMALAGAALAAPGAARAASPKRIVAVMAEGGWDVTFCLDPKFSSAEVDGPWVDEVQANPDDREALQTFGGLQVAVNPFRRPAIGQFFERWHARAAIVNGVWMGAIAHLSARTRLITGTQSQGNPSWTAIAGHALGRELALGSIDLSGGSYSGRLAASTGQLGQRAQVQALILEGSDFPPAEGTGLVLPRFRSDAADREAVARYLADRAGEARARWGEAGAALLADRDEALLRAARFRDEGAPTIGHLELGVEPTLRQQADLAIELLGQDLCRAVTLDSGDDWDTHDGNALQHGYYQDLFAGLHHLVQGLDDAGLLDDTLVVVMSEFTRTPRLNATAGKDHWPHASMLLVGGNVRGDVVLGATDDRVESRRVDLGTGEPTEQGVLNKYDNVAAGILTALDLDPGEWYPQLPPFTAPFV